MSSHLFLAPSSRPASCARLISTLTIAMVCCGGASAAPATPDAISATVRVADLNLASAQGRQQARDRLQATAARLCARFRDSRSLATRETEAECRRDALEAALQQIQPRVVAQGHKSTGEK